MKLRKATAYIRYSDNKQDGNHSIEIQKNQIQQLAIRENLEIVAWRVDKATSAFHGNISKREGIQLLLKDIENGAEAVCFYEESRMTRSITDFYNEVYSPINSEFPFVKFYSTQSDSEWNPNDPITQARLVFAAEESEIKSVRAKDAQDSLLNREQPKRPGSRVPVGYDMLDGVLYPNEDAKVVELIYHLAVWGHSQAIIAEFLNKCSIITKNVKHWNSSTIGYILSNRTYLGELAWNVRTSYDISKPKHEDEIMLFTNIHEPIVSPTIVHLVKQIKDLKDQLGTMNTPFYLRSIIKCKSCNSYLVAKDNSPKNKKGKYRIYKCNSCNKSVSIEPVHCSVLNDLQKKWHSQLDTFVITSMNQLKQWSKKLRKTMDNLKHKREITFLNEKILADDITNTPLLSEVFVTTQNHLQNEITYISNTIEEINLLLQDDYLDVILKEILQQSFGDFTDTELRVFFLIYFDEVLINFAKDNALQISYRLSPFISLEKATG